MAINNQIPKAVITKIYKTGQTRGADDDVIYQNRVLRNSTVLIPYHEFTLCQNAPTNKGKYENGFIVLIKPEEYFDESIQASLKKDKLKLGKNLLVFYETRNQLNKFPIPKSWKPASSRVSPLKGQFVARIPATVAAGEVKINRGYNTSDMKGAGIRVYEYADTATINQCKIQLEFLFWSCKDVDNLMKHIGIDPTLALQRKNFIKAEAARLNLDSIQSLESERIVDSKGFTICPLCLEHISAFNFLEKIVQAKGREVPDLTVTEVSLFHIKELRTGEFNHRPYNLGWGHHHCNVVCKDAGIKYTLDWMKTVLERNGMI